MAVTEEREDQTAAGTARRGFAGRFLGAVQDVLAAATGRGNRAPANASWRANNEEAVAVNARIMAAGEEHITLLGHEVQAQRGSLAGSTTLRLLDERAQAVEDLKAMQETMARDQVNVDVEAGAYTDADVLERRQKLSQLQGANDQLRKKQQQRGPVKQSKFVKGYCALTQSRMFGDFEPGQHAENPSWRENTRKAGSVNRQFMQDSATTLALLERDIAATDPLYSAAHLVALHSDVTGARAAVAEMLFEDERTKDAQAWAWTDDQLAAQGKLVRGLHRITQSLPGQRRPQVVQQPTAAHIAPKDFRSNSTELYHSRKYNTGPSGDRGVNPSWRENTIRARAVNNEFLIKSSWTLTQLDAEIESKTHPSDAGSRASLEALRTEVSEVRESVEELVAQGKDTGNAEAWGWTDVELAAQKKLIGDLDQINKPLVLSAQLRDIESRAFANQSAADPSARRSSPARNADAASGSAKSAGRAVVMNPKHAAGLQDLEGRHDDGLESGDGSYGR